MNKQPILKQLKTYGWLVPVVGLSLATLWVLTRQLPSPPISRAPTPATVAPAPASPPPAGKTLPKPSAPAVTPAPTSSPAPTPSPSPRQAKTPRSPGAPLTPQQDAMNRRNQEAFQASNHSVDSLIDMRVAIAEGVSTATIRTSTDAALLNEAGATLQTLAAEESYAATPNGQGIRLNTTRLPAAILIVPSADGVFYLGDRAYHGQLLLIADAGNLWAVNFVSMRTYLYSVVGSEVSPSWDMEALKAQAVAARSYALTHYFRPVNSVYHLGATERYQVYRGIEREADRTRQAVDATAGEFVSHRGDIVESLYAASDDIVMEAFQGRGMSQLGALALAEQGYTYKQILRNYYPETGVSRIAQDIE